MRKIEIYDTTLRDGAQMRGISFSVNDKLQILECLDELGVAFVEGGWPGANPKDIDFFTEAKKLKLKNTVLTAFGSTRRANTKVEECSILAALLRADTEVICIVSKSSAKQIQTTMKISLEDNLQMLEESVAYLKSKGKRVFVDAEHFFDGYFDNAEYSHKFIQSAMKAGAETVILCDTNGGSLPEQVFNITEELHRLYGSSDLQKDSDGTSGTRSIKFGIHAHNDSELAVANSIRAIRAGATQVQGTVNGIGERCGNANLMSIIPNLQLKYKADQLECVPEENIAQLTSVSKKIADIANMNHNNHQAFVGASAFTHKGGLHASAMQKDKTSYEHIDPLLVGNNTKIIVSEQSGLSNIIDWMRDKDLCQNENSDQVKAAAQEILKRVKDLEHQGYSFENAGASFELVARNILSEINFTTPVERPEYFELIENNTHILNGEQTEATVRIRVGDQELHSASLGNGPANALDTALRKALLDFYPELSDFNLHDYKVRILDSQLGTGAKTVVQITTGNHVDNWNTIGVNPNIIKASWDAITDSIEFGLFKAGIASKHKPGNLQAVGV